MKRDGALAHEKVAALLPQVPCPACGRRELGFSLRCDLGLDACLWTARCEHCATVFEIVTGSGPPTSATLQGATPRCARCGGTDLRPRLRCTLATRACVYSLECASCGPVSPPPA